MIFLEETTIKEQKEDSKTRTLEKTHKNKLLFLKMRDILIPYSVIPYSVESYTEFEPLVLRIDWL